MYYILGLLQKFYIWQHVYLSTYIKSDVVLIKFNSFVTGIKKEILSYDCHLYCLTKPEIFRLVKVILLLVFTN